MLIFNQQNADISVLVWEITESENTLVQLLQNFDYYVCQFTELKNATRKLEFLASRVALQHLFGKPIEVTYLPTGKPQLANENGYISITHTKGYVAIAHHPTCEVGIDIELPTERFKKLYTRFLNPQEQELLFDPTDLSHVLLAWSAKEALYKIIGSQAVDFANQLAIECIHEAESHIVALHLPTTQKFLLHYRLTKAYALVYVADIKS